MDIEFKKLNLKAGDDLIIKVDITGLDEEAAARKLAEISQDEFLNYIVNKGHKVFLTYTGIDVEILRKEKDDVLVAYVNVTGLSQEAEDEYLDYVKKNLRDLDDVTYVPVRNESPKFRVLKKNFVKIDRSDDE